MKTYTKLAILKASRQLKHRMQFEGLDPDDLQGVDFDSVISDLVDQLENAPHLVEAPRILITPTLGFVPVVGNINDDPILGNKVVYYHGDEQ